MNVAQYISDPDVKELARCASKIHSDYISEEPNPWLNSPFAWLKEGLPSSQIGTIVERLVSEWCVAKGFEVTKSPDKEADRIIEGRRVEIKGSTLWKRGIYKFQQIRDQNYDYMFALGISPFDAHAWVIPKELLMRQPDGVISQHRGRSGTDTLWLSFKPGEEYEWMKQHGGTLRDVRKIIASFR